MPLNFILVFRRLYQNHFNTVTLWTLKAGLGGQNMRHKIIWAIFRFRLFNSNQLKKKEVVTPTICGLSTQTLLKLFHQYFGHVSIPRLKHTEKKGSVHGIPYNLPKLE